MGWVGFVIPLGTSSLVRNSQTTNENWPICPRLKLNHVFLWIMVGSCQRCMMAWNQVYFSEAIWNDLLVAHMGYIPLWGAPLIISPLSSSRNCAAKAAPKQSWTYLGWPTFKLENLTLPIVCAWVRTSFLHVK